MLRNRNPKAARLAVGAAFLALLATQGRSDTGKGKRPFVPGSAGNDPSKQCCYPAHADVPALPPGFSDGCVIDDFIFGGCKAVDSACQGNVSLSAYAGFCLGVNQAGTCTANAATVPSISCAQGYWDCKKYNREFSAACECLWFVSNPPPPPSSATNIADCAGSGCP